MSTPSWRHPLFLGLIGLLLFTLYLLRETPLRQLAISTSASPEPTAGRGPATLSEPDTPGTTPGSTGAPEDAASASRVTARGADGALSSLTLTDPPSETSGEHASESAEATVSARSLPPGRVTYYEQSLPTTLNPLFASTMVDHRAHELIFDRLWYRSAITSELQSRLVERWEVVDAGKVLRIQLREGIRWHNGKDVTAEDVCFTVGALLDPGTPSPLAEAYRELLVGCEVKEQAALVRFKRVHHNPRELLSFALLPRSAFASTAITPDLEFSTRPVGSGPFSGAMGRRGVSFSSFSNPHHKQHLGQLSLQEGGDPLVQARTVLNNGVQGIIAVPPPYRDELASSDDVALKSYDLRSWWYVAVNTSEGALADRRVRQGLDLLLDRAELRQRTLGIAPEAQNSPCEFISGPFLLYSPYYNRAVPVDEHDDPAKAELLLTSAGLSREGGVWHHEGAPITLRVGMLASLEVEAPDLLDQIGNQLGAAGFGLQLVKITAEEWNRRIVTGRAADDYDLLIGKWSFGLVEDVSPLFHTRSGQEGRQNLFNYSDPTTDRLLDMYGAAITDTEAQDANRQLHAHLAEELPYLYLWKLDTKSAWRTEVRGNIISPFYYFTEVDSWRLTP